MQLMSYMLNAHLVAPVKFEAKPYLLGGLGFATAYVDKPSKGNDTKLAYEVGVGIGLEVKRNLALDFSYRYLGASDFDINGAIMPYSSNNILLGVRYSY
jgi:opacity protein-like surface antigen